MMTRVNGAGTLGEVESCSGSSGVVVEGAAGGGRQGKRKRWRQRSETWNNASVKEGKRATRRSGDWQARASLDGGRMAR